MPKLKPKQEAFVDHLLSDARRNATQAAIKAGYSKNCAKEIGYENLTKPHIKSMIEEKLEPIKQKLAIDRDYIVENLHHLVETCKDTGSEHFDPAAVNRSLELLMKALGLSTDKIQLQAEVNNRHSVDMVRLLEVDSTSQEAFETIMERHRQQRLEEAQ